METKEAADGKENTRCAKQVREPGVWPRFSQCKKRAIEGGTLCRQHQAQVERRAAEDAMTPKQREDAYRAKHLKRCFCCQSAESKLKKAKEMKRQRDDLLAACEDGLKILVELADTYVGYIEDHDPAVAAEAELARRQMKAAIAKARG